jgi:hypothetical protein
VVDIEFVKKDGANRIMTCTLREDSLPKQIGVEELINTRKGNPDVLAVFDVINQGWRSFRWNSLKTVNGQPFSWD